MINQKKVNQQLMEAVTQQNMAGVKASLAAGAEVETRNSNGATALLVATELDNLVIAKLLLAKGANVNLQDNKEDSPFLFAGAEGRLALLKELAKHDPDQRVVNRFGGNALIPAAEKGHLETVCFLLEKTQVAVNHVNNLGWTALLEAIILSDGGDTQQEIVNLLLANGANPNMKDAKGVSPLRHAKDMGFDQIAQALIEAGGRE